jgi:hypothetical protein
MAASFPPKNWLPSLRAKLTEYPRSATDIFYSSYSSLTNGESADEMNPLGGPGDFRFDALSPLYAKRNLTSRHGYISLLPGFTESRIILALTLLDMPSGKALPQIDKASTRILE